MFSSRFKMYSALLKTEIRKVWGFPILELAVGFVLLISVTTIPTLLKIIAQNEFGSEYSYMIASAIYNSVNAELLPVGLFCGILVSLSFARDYEQGLMQMLLSSPVPRSAIFIIKLMAVAIPLTLILWGLTLSAITLNFYSEAASVFMILQLTAWALPTIFLAVMFYGGIAILISLSTRRAIPSALASMIIGFILYYLTTLKTETIGPFADYLSVTPFKAPLAGLGKVLDLTTENTLENALPTWSFLTIAFVYALLFLLPMYLYFTRRFEVRE